MTEITPIPTISSRPFLATKETMRVETARFLQIVIEVKISPKETRLEIATRDKFSGEQYAHSYKGNQSRAAEMIREWISI